MKINDLISKLQEFAQKKGNVNVIVRDTVNGDNYDICSIGSYRGEETVTIEI